MLSTQRNQAAMPMPSLVPANTCEPVVLCESDQQLTTPRRTNGRTLQILGHAAEHLTDQLTLDNEAVHVDATREAIHILLRLSREVFEEYANATRRYHPADWLMRQDIGVYGAA
jgi:hypothetical protein